MFQKGMQNRQHFWRTERAHAAIACNSSFIGSMAKRNLEANIQYDHGLGHMFIKVSLILEQHGRHTDRQVRETVSQSQADSTGHTQVGPRQYKTPKTMSGGERSFTTVSLLLAMWKLSSSPIRCLDEWDVFLDTANRSVAAGMLVCVLDKIWADGSLMVPRLVLKLNSSSSPLKYVIFSDSC